MIILNRFEKCRNVDLSVISANFAPALPMLPGVSIALQRRSMIANPEPRRALELPENAAKSLACVAQRLLAFIPASLSCLTRSSIKWNQSNKTY
jgi:hypothetical protein